ncbi:DUF11 domain-containing protein [Paenibacillus sp. J2TS4]|uniref:DUF11 domain-containing protein n=1 Tax=Paenibacillus sp. J2TS4 TaxID=2807194 RepID=UPI001BCBA6C0|nr:DUF11 domain-containing protein [Paenibacillus sp. J2TS4]
MTRWLKKLLASAAMTILLASSWSPLAPLTIMGDVQTVYADSSPNPVDSPPTNACGQRVALINEVPEGQEVTRFAFGSVSSAPMPGGNDSLSHGNVLDDIFLGTGPCVTATKSVLDQAGNRLDESEVVYVGDELTYEVTVKNEGGDIAAGAIFEDLIPEGTEYVSGSMKIINDPLAGNLTDEEDSDPGHFDGEKVTIRLGDLPNTDTLPEGVTVQFKVKVLLDKMGENLANQALVTYKNLLKNPEEESQEEQILTNPVTIIPMDPPPIPPTACGTIVPLINCSFEEPPSSADDSRLTKKIGWFDAPNNAVPGWNTTAPSGLFEIMNKVWEMNFRQFMICVNSSRDLSRERNLRPSLISHAPLLLLF